MGAGGRIPFQVSMFTTATVPALAASAAPAARPPPAKSTTPQASARTPASVPAPALASSIVNQGRVPVTAPPLVTSPLTAAPAPADHHRHYPYAGTTQSQKPAIAILPMDGMGCTLQVEWAALSVVQTRPLDTPSTTTRPSNPAPVFIRLKASVKRFAIFLVADHGSSCTSPIVRV